MKSNLTVYIIGFPDSYYEFLWECVESCCGFCSDVVFCDLGAPESALSLMCDYRRVKKDHIPTIYFDDFRSAMTSLSREGDGWVFVLFPDEIVHENSWHYLWDLSVNHTDCYDGALITVLDSLMGEVNVTESVRMVSRRHLDLITACSDGVELINENKLNMVPGGLFPAPAWKMPVEMSRMDEIKFGVPGIIANSPR